MLAGVTTGTRAAERPCDQADLIHMPQRPHIVHRGPDIVPVRLDGRQRMRVARRARRRSEGDLAIVREIARIVHRRRPRRPPVAGRVHGEDVVARAREVGHPAVVLIRDIERHFGRRSRAVDEHDDSILQRRAAQSRTGEHFFADVDLSRLAGDGRHRRLHVDVVIDRQQPLAVVGG